MSRDERKAMIALGCSSLSQSRQCRLLSISRSSFYYAPRGESAENRKRRLRPIGYPPFAFTAEERVSS
jgi:hypothetical protein